MESVHLVSILKEGTEREISDASYKLLNSSDLSELISLAKHLEEIDSIISDISGNGEANNQRVLNSIDKITRFLDHIRDGGCRCFKYTISAYMPHSEAEKGLINILSEDSNPQTWETYSVCECTLCKKKYQVHDYEAGFGHRADWSAIS